MKERPVIYLDYASGTPLHGDVDAAMQPFFRERFANPRALHRDGVANKEVIEEARASIGKLLNASQDELYFTSGGTDANMRALWGVVNALQDSGRELSNMHVVVSMLEHSSVRACAEMFARRGLSVSFAPVTTEGVVDVTKLQELIQDNTVLVSVMLVNNEIGTVQPIEEIAKIIREKRKTSHGQTPLLHTDATQAPLTIRLDMKKLGADLVTLDAYKMYGPAGSGLLFVRTGVPYVGLCGVLHGRSGYEGATPNTGAIVGLEKALTLAQKRYEETALHFNALSTYLIKRIHERFSECIVNGEKTECAGGIVNVTFPGSEGEFLVAQLSEHGIAASAKSACLSGGGEGSYVIAAFDREHANNTIRFSFGYSTTREDIDVLMSVLSDIIS
ncbi:MAG: cysteine desulfurase family protein [Patescibacteria group bacterium]